MKCPNCGAEIEQNSRFCSFCNSPITVEMLKNQEQLNKAGCPRCGSTNVSFRRENQGEIRGKNGKAIVHKTVGMCKDCGNTWYTDGSSGATSQKKKSNTWLWVLGWIFIFPLPLTILMLRKKDMKPALKYGIIAAAWVVYLLIGLSARGRNENENHTTQTTQSITEEVTAEDSSVEESSESQESKDKTDNNSDDNFTFLIDPNEKGDYGFENTLNKGTDSEETQIVYHIPAGTYKVKNLGEYQGQIEACSDNTHVTDEGWEEPEDSKGAVAIKPDEEVEFTIEDGYYLEVHINGKLGFTEVE